jgi:Ca-activated chloride channel family protein
VSEKARIAEAIDALQCGRSTNLEEGMERAYAVAAENFVGGAENRVLLLSDGVANLGTVAAEDILARIEKYRKQGIYCSVFGFGIGTYDDAMLETLANKGDGTYRFIDSEAEAQRVFVDELAATLNTIAADVKIQVEFNPRRVRRYRQLGYENRQLRKEDFRNDAVDAGEVGSGQSVTALYELELSPERGWARDDVIAIVRVRYRRTDTEKVEEIESAVCGGDLVTSFDEASVRFRLAACVAEFAEILRASPFAAGTRSGDVGAVLRPVALELHLDERVQELLRMVQTADSMPRGEF